MVQQAFRTTLQTIREKCGKQTEWKGKGGEPGSMSFDIGYGGGGVLCGGIHLALVFIYLPRQNQSHSPYLQNRCCLGRQERVRRLMIPR